MKQIKITIAIPMDGAIHEHSAAIPYDENNDVMAKDALTHFLYLCQNVYGETDTHDAVEAMKNKW